MNLRQLLPAAILAAGCWSVVSAQDSKPVRVTVDNFKQAESDNYFTKFAKDGGFGKIAHERGLAPIDKQTVIRMNRDTLYSAAVFDLNPGPATIFLPDSGERFLSLQTQLPPWLLARTRRALEAMLTAAETWIADLPAGRSLAGSEVRLDVAVPPDGLPDGPTGSRPVRLDGRADRLDRAPDGSLIVVDFKTGATVPSKASVAENAQLAVYQLALELGAAEGLGEHVRSFAAQPDVSGELPDEPFDGEPPPDESSQDSQLLGGGPADPLAGQRPGGAELVFLRSGTPNVRQQPALAPEAALQWRRTVRDAAQRLASSVSVAQENRYCERCPVRTSCPLQPEGRQVTR